MKREIKQLSVFILTILSLFSCSDNLTESKVEELVNDCLSKNPIYGQSILESGRVNYLSNENIKNYQELEKKGYLKIEEKTHRSGWKSHQIELTDKAKPYILETNNYGETISNKIKLFTHKLDKVGSIQEIPSMNIAEVSVTYKKDEKTPFYDLMEIDKTDFIIKKIGIKKTENKGWIYCEN
jgi:hypothetical protein